MTASNYISLVCIVFLLIVAITAAYQSRSQRQRPAPLFGSDWTVNASGHPMWKSGEEQ